MLPSASDYSSYRHAESPAAARPAEPRGVAVLGSTGSIGTQTLDVIRLFPDHFRVRSLTCGSNVELLIEQAREFRPACVAVGDASKASRVEDALDGLGIEVVAGADGLCHAAALEDVDIAMAAVVGFAGLEPVLAAARRGITVALANKETLVVAGALVNDLLDRTGGALIPVDSEHSAIFQCLAGEARATLERVVLTASGGPFRARPKHTFDAITRDEALDHPNWDMGPKITIDSATLMNKGLEVIEAKWLFDLTADEIDVLVHPQSIVHSMAAFTDGSVKAQLGVPDMKVPIQYALTFPARWPAPHERLDWAEVGRLDFEQPDTDKFPCLRLAFEALEAGGTAPAVLNAANEVAVDLFLHEKIGFADIPRVIEDTIAACAGEDVPDLDTLQEIDADARRTAKELTLPAAN